MATRQPSPAAPTTRSRRRARAVEEHLVELRRSGELPDRPDGDARLLHRHEKIGQPGRPPGPRLGPGEQEAPVGDGRQRRPDLLPGDDPVDRHPARPTCLPTRGLTRRRARSSPGTRAPSRRRWGQEPLLLLGRAERRSASGRAVPRPYARRVQERRYGRTPRGRSPAGRASRPGRRTVRASRCKSSRLPPAGGSRPVAARTARAHGRVRPARAGRRMHQRGSARASRGSDCGTPRLQQSAALASQVHWHLSCTGISRGRLAARQARSAPSPFLASVAGDK